MSSQEPHGYAAKLHPVPAVPVPPGPALTVPDTQDYAAPIDPAPVMRSRAELQSLGKSEIHENAGAVHALVSYFINVGESEPTRTIPIDEFAKSIQSGDFAEEVQRVRDVLADGKASGMQAAELKRVVNEAKKTNLSAVSISGEVTSGGRSNAFKEERFKHSGMLQVDIDKADLGGRNPVDVRNLIGKDPHIHFACLSPTGEGVKGIMRVPICASDKEHAAAFRAAESYLISGSLRSLMPTLIFGFSILYGGSRGIQPKELEAYIPFLTDLSRALAQRMIDCRQAMLHAERLEHLRHVAGSLIMKLQTGPHTPRDLIRRSSGTAPTGFHRYRTASGGFSRRLDKSMALPNDDRLGRQCPFGS